MATGGSTLSVAVERTGLVEVRPRTTGEIMDDASRLALADAPTLLALTALFAVPAAAAVLLLLALPTPEDWWTRCLLPGLTAFLLPLTGIGAGACQELLRRRAEAKPVSLWTCLQPALRRGLDHMAGRVLVWALPLLVSLLLALAALPVVLGMKSLSEGGGIVLVMTLLGGVIGGAILQSAAGLGGATVHAILVDSEKKGAAAWWEAVRENRPQMWKVVVVAGTRPILLLMACINLFLFIQVGLWAAENLLGFNLAVVGVALGGGNALFLLSLALGAYILLAPFAEAANYLLHVDARARYEGLDLWYRVRRLFPDDRRAALVLLLSLGAALLGTRPAHADTRLDTVRAARTELRQIAAEIKNTADYRDGSPWVARLTDIGARLDRDGSDRPGRYRWFTQALTGFARQTKEGALEVLADLERRLALIEDSLAPPDDGAKPRTKADIKALLPPVPAEENKGPRPTTSARRPPEEAKRPAVEDDEARQRRGRRQGPGAMSPQASGGFGSLMWLIIAAALVASLVAALVLFQRRQPRKPVAPAAAAPAKTETLSLESLLNQADQQGGAGMWRQADDLARGGKFLDAVRTLYLAVLAMLHRADLIRYAPTRTNGEYLRQLRGKEPVQRPFRGLTGLFEIKWYGERHCEPGDYDACRRLADQVREGMQTAPPT